MTKKLHIESITSELEGSVFFPRKATVKQEEPNPTPLPEKQQNTQLVSQERQQNRAISERVNTRSTVRKKKRIITRNSFEIYEDQMDSLRKLSLGEKMEGRPGSMSAMVRDAIDTYLQKKDR